MTPRSKKGSRPKRHSESEDSDDSDVELSECVEAEVDSDGDVDDNCW